MILPAGDVAVTHDEHGNYCFHSGKVDLNTEPLIYAIPGKDGVGTLEVWKYHVVSHPANGPDMPMSINEIMEIRQRKAK
jgi:hypothetical protein